MYLLRADTQKNRGLHADGRQDVLQRVSTELRSHLRCTALPTPLNNAFILTDEQKGMYYCCFNVHFLISSTSEGLAKSLGQLYFSSVHCAFVLVYFIWWSRVESVISIFWIPIIRCYLCCKYFYLSCHGFLIFYLAVLEFYLVESCPLASGFIFCLRIH